MLVEAQGVDEDEPPQPAWTTEDNLGSSFHGD